MFKTLFNINVDEEMENRSEELLQADEEAQRKRNAAAERAFNTLKRRRLRRKQRIKKRRQRKQNQNHPRHQRTSTLFFFIMPEKRVHAAAVEEDLEVIPYTWIFSSSWRILSDKQCNNKFFNGTIEIEFASNQQMIIARQGDDTGLGTTFTGTDKFHLMVSPPFRPVVGDNLIQRWHTLDYRIPN
ncbi:unnamed protein product, partial [Porites lobata]